MVMFLMGSFVCFAIFLCYFLSVFHPLLAGPFNLFSSWNAVVETLILTGLFFLIKRMLCR